MFLSRRSTQAEYFDTGRPAAELREFFRALNQVNRLFAFQEPFLQMLPRLLGEAECGALSILDLGAGDGLLGRTLSDRAQKRGWTWRVTNLDHSRLTLALSGTGRNVAGSALALPFAEGSFDAVIASQMTHHLTDEQAKVHLREAWRVAKKAVVIADLRRSKLLYLVIWTMLLCRRFPRTFGEDALLSVRRSWRVKELQTLVRRAGLQETRVESCYGARVLIYGVKPTT
jgi:ubiquinone/menaquinone biosynthesis C-methylase UbiE